MGLYSHLSCPATFLLCTCACLHCDSFRKQPPRWVKLSRSLVAFPLNHWFIQVNNVWPLRLSLPVWMGAVARTRSRGMCSLSPGVPATFVDIKIISKSLLQMRLTRLPHSGQGGREVLVCGLRGLLFRTDEDSVNRGVVEERQWSPSQDMKEIQVVVPYTRSYSSVQRVALIAP